MASTGNQSFSCAMRKNNAENHIVVPKEKSWKNLFAYMGPGFLVSIAYIDPGNFETDMQSGSQYQYGLLWVILWASCAALVIQSLAANLGVVTGKHLAEHCRIEYPKIPKLILWFLAEMAIVACDIPEVIGSAFAINMLFKIPLWCGVLLTGLSTLILLALQKYGVRKLEVLITFLVSTMAVCFFAELNFAKPDAKEVIGGLFIPRLRGQGATGLAISLFGAMIMPHNLFLHSALVLSRKIPQTVPSIKEACRFYMIESAFALMVAFLINVSVISVSGAVCHSPNLNSLDQARCEDLDLNEASFLLKNVLGTWSSKLFAIALLASGQSSTITGTYAGQYVMQGFLDLQMKPWIRNLLTRCLAIVPSLIVAIVGGSSGAGKLIIIASMILSFELPFALIPLLKFTSSKATMGNYANSTTISAIIWVIGSLMMGINIYYLASSFIRVLLHSHLQLELAIFCGFLGFSCIILYICGIGYLVFRKNKEAPGANQLADESGNSAGTANSLPGEEEIAIIQLSQTNLEGCS